MVSEGKNTYYCKAVPICSFSILNRLNIQTSFFLGGCLSLGRKAFKITNNNIFDE